MSKLPLLFARENFKGGWSLIAVGFTSLFQTFRPVKQRGN
jgi:hypothetical protein